MIFLVTEIGCGLAGYRPKDIAPLFMDAHDVVNVNLPRKFWRIVEFERRNRAEVSDEIQRRLKEQGY